jgi:hypothetical protein
MFTISYFLNGNPPPQWGTLWLNSNPYELAPLEEDGSGGFDAQLNIACSDTVSLGFSVGDLSVLTWGQCTKCQKFRGGGGG